MGNTAVVVAPLDSALAPFTFGEVLATSDLPKGVAHSAGSHTDLGPGLRITMTLMPSISAAFLLI